MHGQRSRVLRGLLDPERLEVGKLLAARIAGADRKAARREPITKPFGDSPEIAGAQKRADFVEIIMAVHGRMQPKSGEAHVACRRRLAAIECEQIWRIDDRLRALVDHLIKFNAVGEQEASMKELQLERQSFVAPQRAFGLVANAPIGVVSHLAEGARQLRVRRLERLRGKIGGHAAHIRAGELLRPLGGARRGGVFRHGDGRERGGQKRTAIQDGLRQFATPIATRRRLDNRRWPRLFQYVLTKPRPLKSRPRLLHSRRPQSH